MRQRLKNFLPILLMALLVQIFAPIGACWAAGIAASDPFGAAVICHGNTGSTSDSSDSSGQRAHDGCCSVCSVLQTGAPVDVPESAVAEAILRIAAPVVWYGFETRLQHARIGSNAQARAPPTIS